MEPWEQMLVISILVVMIALISFALTRYFPQFVVFSLNRTRYYVIGSDVKYEIYQRGDYFYTCLFHFIYLCST
ncbi:hypothetical protein PNOK_0657900 [Pyrrhoderma noxium]|uniref:Uncharacterized protein n=1 Tax=Pyrrhoderma noxium TaxID=2282107 RepID=A0A286UER5_9AGAM|nr:hypothetical protein PNOK_0657900 [Pyrrhoderma noxium]